MKSRILIVAAHPDDEILGCGGAVASLVAQGAEAFTLILGEGKTARDEKRDLSKRKKEIADLHQEAQKANNTIGVKELILHDFPDNRFDSVALLDIVKVVEKVKIKFKPDIVFTHFARDLNIDHRVTYNAVVTATRPMAHETVKEIYSFENISSTEWSFPLSFSPNIFFDISKTIKKKIKALSCYASEMRASPHPRSLEAVELNAKMWGIKQGRGFVEAFEAVRIVR